MSSTTEQMAFFLIIYSHMLRIEIQSIEVDVIECRYKLTMTLKIC